MVRKINKISTQNESERSLSSKAIDRDQKDILQIDIDYAVDNDDYIACTANASPGDMFSVFTDGARWYVHGLCKDASETPFATAAG